MVSPGFHAKMRALRAQIDLDDHDDRRTMKELVYGAAYDHERERARLTERAADLRNEADRLSTGSYP